MHQRPNSQGENHHINVCYWYFLDSSVNMPFATCFPTPSKSEVVRAVAVLILSAWTSSSSSTGSSAHGWASLLWGELLWRTWKRMSRDRSHCQRWIKYQPPGDFTIVPFFQSVAAAADGPVTAASASAPNSHPCSQNPFCSVVLILLVSILDIFQSAGKCYCFFKNQVTHISSVYSEPI